MKGIMKLKQLQVAWSGENTTGVTSPMRLVCSSISAVAAAAAATWI